MYRVYGILTPATDFTLAEAARRLAARFPPNFVRMAAGLVTAGTDDWAMQLQIVEGPEAQAEHEGIAGRLAGGDAAEIATCDRRVEAWSDMPDIGMEHFADFQTVIDVLKSFRGVVTVDPKEPCLL
jgi:hypothetical protein